MRENTDQKELRIWTLFTQWLNHSLITKLKAFWFFTIGFFMFLNLLFQFSISWSNILKLILPEQPSTNYFYIITFIDVLYSTYYLHRLLLQHGDIETNPGSPKGKIRILLWCHWNVDSLIAHNVFKIFLSAVYNAIYTEADLALLQHPR